MKSARSKIARNQRREKPEVGRLRVFSGVKATVQTTTSGASMNTTTVAWNDRAKGPF